MIIIFIWFIACLCFQYLLAKILFFHICLPPHGARPRGGAAEKYFLKFNLGQMFSGLDLGCALLMHASRCFEEQTQFDAMSSDVEHSCSTLLLLLLLTVLFCLHVPATACLAGRWLSQVGRHPKGTCVKC